ncbi:hypothetical protein PC116_g19441 [Phytophthora cactorum]|nr:hypothetical protein PC116_g19441 [Phytophthora cactorum]
MQLPIMEAKFYNKQQDTPTTNEVSINTESNEPPAKRRRTSGATNLKDVWFTWYTQEPRMWSSTDAGTTYARSTAKQVIAFLKLFLPDGFKLHEKSPRYRDEVLKIGEAAEVELLAYLRGRDITARGTQNVLKSMRKLHKSGHLNDQVRRYQKLEAANCIEDPAPAHTTKILGPANDAESDDEAESSTDEDLEGEKQHYVRKLLNWKHQNRKTYYLVDWEPTWEPREHLNKTLVAAFEKERRLLVRKTFFEDEAVEDNTLNYTEA